MPYVVPGNEGDLTIYNCMGRDERGFNGVVDSEGLNCLQGSALVV